MPWNITASVQSSQHGSVTANIFRGLGSVSDFSSHGFGEPSGLGPQRSRLTSASPLAGRGYPPDIEGLPGFADDELEDFDLSHYLQTELHGDGFANAMDLDLDTTGANKGKEPMRDPPLSLRDRIIQSNLDQDSLNFLEFVMKKIEDLSASPTEDIQAPAFEDPHTDPSIQLKGLPFSTLLPRRKTSRAVATHGLAHTLALATKGILSVRQEDYTDLTTEEYGAKYEYGEIFLRLA
ncbi:R8 protein [Aspergillus melleus]|uniref:R8 protein n=1 Tax=Aspergillus melleus TaxID=138277 RepID=UPI001E8DA003|nr:R8 protein [Aspergillus melleus]KAH8431527.1 R8 protein [Aspergillus melleus]